MKYKIQSRTIFGWMDVMGDFESIKEAQKKIPFLQGKLQSPYYLTTFVLRIVPLEEFAVNDFYVYDKEEL
jgi:hypothetical protein